MRHSRFEGTVTVQIEDLPTVTAAMPCRKERRYIEQRIRSVLTMDYPAGRRSLLVDAMSDDGTWAILEDLARQDNRIRVIDNPGLLPAPAMNLAMEPAKCEIFLRVDAHTIYSSDYARRSDEILLETGAENVGGLWETIPGAGTPTAAAIAYALGNKFGVGSAHYRTGVISRREADTVPFGCWRLETLKKLGDSRLIFRLRRMTR
jgi:cellulose synthase/poly-beta-1,6-N-acetylglucosamine synthase-like glycosyltransferase